MYNKAKNGNENATKTIILHCVVYILVHFLSSSAKQQFEMTKFEHMMVICFLFLYFNTIHRDLDPGQFANIFHVNQIGTITKTGSYILK